MSVVSGTGVLDVHFLYIGTYKLPPSLMATTTLALAYPKLLSPPQHTQ